MALTQVTYPGFTIDTSVGTSFGATSSRIALPGTPGSDTLVRIVNLGPNTISVALGGNTVVATTQNLAIIPGQEIFLVIGAATYIAGIAHGSVGMGSTTNITTGA
jgi:hypothetical protein